MKLKAKYSELIKFLTLSVFICVILFYITEFSLKTALIQGQSSAFYIPAGLSVAILIVCGARYLPIILLAKFVLGLSHERTLYHNLISCIASGTEAYVGYYLFKSFHHLIDEYFEYQSHLIMVILLGVISPVFSAFIGVTNLYYMGFISESSYFSTFFTWYFGDLISIFIFLPAFLAYGREKHRIFDFFAPVIVLALTLFFKFEVMAPFIYVLFLAILIPAIFGSIMGIYYSLITVSCVLNWFLIAHVGPFSLGSYQENMLSMQYFLLAISVTALSLEGFKRTNLLKSALIPFLTFWLFTAVVYYHYHTQKDRMSLAIITKLTQDFGQRLIDKMNIYENSIKGASGFVIGSEFVSNEEWIQYVKSISVVNNISGVKGIGIIYPPLKKSKIRSIIYPTQLNFNHNFENLINLPEIAGILQQVINIDNPILSASLKINLDGKKESTYSLLINSVIKDGQLVAWIIAPIDMTIFFKSVAEKYPSVDIDIFDGETIFNNSRVFTKVIDARLRSTPSFTNRVSSISLANHPFTIDWNQTLRYVTAHGSQNTLLILIGSILSFIFTTFFLKLKLISVMAHKLADSKTLELRESEEKFKSLFENSSDAVILFNAIEIFDCNPESIKLFGKRNKKELLTMPLNEFLSVKDLNSSENGQYFESKIREVKYKKMVKFECFCLRGALPFFAEIHLHYIEVNENFIYQAVIRDISERRKIEQNLTKSKELAEDAAKAKSSFLSRMSHEIRTPLNDIIGMINNIVTDNPKTEIKEDLETIKNSADNLLSIVTEVLDYNQIDSSQFVLEMRSFNLNNFCEDIVSLHRIKAAAKKLNLQLDLDVKIPEEVIGDVFRNTQIINILLTNSIKYTNTGKVILNVRLKQKKEDSCLIEFKVSDTGIGIDNNKLDEILKDFTPTKNNHIRKNDGTGLGLAIVKRLVEIQNGRIGVVSKINQGTCFTYTIEFSLKTNSIENITTITLENEQVGFMGHRILLVEDNQINIIVTKKFLEKWGLKVDIAMNGLEAVNHARSMNYDLILMDLHMPLMDGLEATKKIREFNKDTPIIGLSADVMTESVASLQAIGMNDFVTKPFAPSSFYHKLKSYL